MTATTSATSRTPPRTLKTITNILTCVTSCQTIFAAALSGDKLTKVIKSILPSGVAPKDKYLFKSEYLVSIIDPFDNSAYPTL